MKKKLLVCVLITMAVMVYVVVGLLFYLNSRNNVSADNSNDLDITFYTVNFNSCGGSLVDAQHVTAGSYATAPEVTKSGCQFLGWYVNLQDAKPFDFNTPIAGDLTLYANWKTIYFTVTYETCGGEALSAQPVASGKKLDTPVPVWNDLEFEGWYLDENYQQLFNPNLPITRDITLYAKWPLTLALSEDGQSYVVEKYTGTATKVTLPVTYLGLSVTAIGDFAFEDCVTLQTVIISDNIKMICDSAFEGCISLTTIVIPNTVESIGQCAFKDCSSLTAITIPSSVENVDKFILKKCSALEKINCECSETYANEHWDKKWKEYCKVTPVWDYQA